MVVRRSTIWTTMDDIVLILPSPRRVRGRGRRGPPSNSNHLSKQHHMRCFSSLVVVCAVVTLLLPHHGDCFQAINYDCVGDAGRGRRFVREVEGGRRRMRVSPPPQSISSMPKVWLSTSSSSYSTVAFMTSTESLTYHDVESSTNGSSSTTSLDEIAVLPPPTTTTTVPTKEAAMDIQALVNDAAASSSAYAGEKNNNGIDVDEIPPPTYSAKDILALENEAASAAAASSGGFPLVSDGSNVGNNGGGGGLPFAPMMTYQKYLTMQEKRVKVTIRYSAEAGLRPFYLTVADQIKSAHPDVLLEKRILPRVAGGGGADEAVFEVIVDGRTIIGKKKTRMLKVSSSTSSSSRGGGSKSSSSSSMSNGDEDDDDIVVGGNISEEREDSRRSYTPDIAGGRTVFIGMERLAAELAKARKKRRPNTSYRSESLWDDARGGAMSTTALTMDVGGGGAASGQSAKMTEAVIRLERLKAMGGARNKA